jgi:AraC-like DNA-binding protein
MRVNKYVSKKFSIDKIAQENPDSMEVPHSHDAYELFFLMQLEGEASITIDDKIYPITEGSVVIIDSNLSHQTNYSQATFRKRYLLEMEPTIFEGGSSQLIGLNIPDFFHKNTGVHNLNHAILTKLENILKLVYDESIFREQYHENIVVLRFLEIIVLLNRQFESEAKQLPTNQTQKQLIEPVVHYIADHIQEELSLSLLSQKFFINKAYLAREFKRYTNQTVHEFINERKIERAMRYVTLHPNCKTKDISTHLSFNDTSYFCKLFKKYAGISLQQFIKETIEF